jgi:hypothetical protein
LSIGTYNLKLGFLCLSKWEADFNINTKRKSHDVATKSNDVTKA